jgi:hypothetical protein
MEYDTVLSILADNTMMKVMPNFSDEITYQI